jgi:hypothetical protein
VECNHCEVLGPVEKQYLTKTQSLLVSRRNYNTVWTSTCNTLCINCNTVQTSTCNTVCINSLHWQVIKNKDVGLLQRETIRCILRNVVGHVMSCHVTAADKYF